MAMDRQTEPLRRKAAASREADGAGRFAPEAEGLASAGAGNRPEEAVREPESACPDPASRQEAGAWTFKAGAEAGKATEAEAAGSAAKGGRPAGSDKAAGDGTAAEAGSAGGSRASGGAGPDAGNPPDETGDAERADGGAEAESGGTGEEESQAGRQEEDPRAQEWYNRYLRVMADFDNYRRRTQREKEELAQYASMKLIGELLPVLDNFERALQTVGKADRQETANAEGQPDGAPAGAAQTEYEAFRKGVEMIYRQLRQVLEADGLKAMEPVGQPFDPNVHQAVMRVPSDEYEEGTVVEVLQTGYWFKDKVLRPALVKVCG